MTMNAFSQPMGAAHGRRSQGRLQVVIAKVLGDVFARSRSGLGVSLTAVLLVPCLFAFVTAFKPGPAMADTVLRNFFPVFLGIAAVCVSGLLASHLLMRETLTRTMEPLLTSGVKRWEIVLGQFVALMMIWSAFTAVVVAELAAFAQGDPADNALAIAGYFHPDAGLWASLAVVLLSGGAMVFAIAGVFGANSDSRPLLIAIPLFLTMMILSSRCEMLMAFVPYINVIFATMDVFCLHTGSGPDDPSSGQAPAWHQAYFTEAAVAVAVVYTVALLIVTVRRLTGGMDYVHRAR